MKYVITVLLLLCIFLTSCSKNNTVIPMVETTTGAESAAPEMPAISSISTDTNTNETAIVGTWEDSIATKQRTQGVSNEEFSNFTDEERERYFAEFGTAPGITIEFKNDGTFSGNTWSDAVDGKYEIKSDGVYDMTFTAHENIWTAVVNGDSMIFSVDIPELKRIKSTAETTTQTLEPWVDVYTAILNGDNELGIDFYNYDLSIDGPENRRYYGCGLYDLDKDETPELFVCIGMWEGSYYHIFTFKDGKGVYVGQVYGRFVEKSTGILFNVTETGYTPDIAYKYTQDGITEIPNYVQLLYETDGVASILRIKLGDNIYDYSFDHDLYIVSIYDDLEWAVTNQEIDNQ